MAGLDYRHAGIDYRHATSDYRGSLDATVSPAVVAAVAAVPAPTVSGAATVAAGVVARGELSSEKHLFVVQQRERSH